MSWAINQGKQGSIGATEGHRSCELRGLNRQDWYAFHAGVSCGFDSHRAGPGPRLGIGVDKASVVYFHGRYGDADEAASIVPPASARTTGASSLLLQGRAACDQI